LILIPEFKGLGTFDTEDKLKVLTGDDKLKVLAIGPGGENLVPFSCVSSERYRQLGRGGMGAVMGSKNLKAITIRGWLDVAVADIKKCMKISMAAHIKDGVIDPENEIYTLGTSCLVDYSQESGLLPTRNFSEGTMLKMEMLLLRVPNSRQLLYADLP
jgi:aldehyde:ferredoxin oxidoreductase